MTTKISHLIMQHDLTLVLLAALICALGSWVTARLYRYARNRPQNRAVRWHMLTALTAGVTIWCTHFVAMLGFRPNVPVNFDLFARFFRDVAETPDALYLDGNVSRLYAPGFGRTDGGLPMGPILGTVVPAP